MVEPKLGGGKELWPAIAYFFKLAWIGFGGPLAHIAMMQDEAVERRRWLTKDEFTEMLGLTNMLPGPNSTELAIHIGYRIGGRRGGLLTGFAFTFPAFAMMALLSWLYFTYRAIPSVEGLFYGINPVVVVLIAVTVWRLGRSAITDWKLLLIALGSFLGSVLTPVNEALILLMAGGVGILLYGPPFQKLGKGLAAFLSFPLSLAASPALPTTASLALVFLKAGSLLFGTGFVIIPLLAPDVVATYQWMTQKEFFDGVTLGQVTPGPVVKTATFVGFKAGGLLGAAVATVAIFLPPFVLVLSLAPILKRLRQNPWLQGFLRGVRPGAVGTILGIVVFMAQAAFVDLWTVGIAAASFVALLRFMINTPLLVVGAGIVGVLLRSLV